MGTCFYDNPSPAQREVWRDGALIQVIPEDLLRTDGGRIESLRSGCPFAMYEPFQTGGDILAIPAGHHALCTTTYFQMAVAGAHLSAIFRPGITAIKKLLGA